MVESPRVPQGSNQRKPLGTLPSGQDDPEAPRALILGVFPTTESTRFKSIRHSNLLAFVLNLSPVGI